MRAGQGAADRHAPAQLSESLPKKRRISFPKSGKKDSSSSAGAAKMAVDTAETGVAGAAAEEAAAAEEEPSAGRLRQTTCSASPANLMTSPPCSEIESMSRSKYLFMYLWGGEECVDGGEDGE